VSVGNGAQKSVEKTWEQTQPGQGWVYSTRHAAYFILSWKDENGDYEEIVLPAKTTAFQSKTDLYIELQPHGSMASRPIEPLPENGSVWAFILLYFVYCVVASLLIGVPLAIGIVLAYVLFKFTRVVLIATFQGLHGDRSVFQFTIREIALLTTVAALACGWFVHFLGR
jgi:hypothetical protein